MRLGGTGLLLIFLSLSVGYASAQQTAYARHGSGDGLRRILPSRVPVS